VPTTITTTIPEALCGDDGYTVTTTTTTRLDHHLSHHHHHTGSPLRFSEAATAVHHH